MGPAPASHLRFSVHSSQLDGTVASLKLMSSQASAAVLGALGHAMAASFADVKANLKSLGRLNPLASSQDWSVNALSVTLMLKE